MTAFVSFLRGINVGGHQVKMIDLKALYLALGCEAVVTHIQSGNVLYTSDEPDPTQQQTRIATAFAERFGFTSEVIVRTVAELHTISARNPFLGQPERAPEWIVVMLLTEQPADDVQAVLHVAYAGPEEFQVSGKELFLYYPNGIGRSKLTNALLEKLLKTRGTARNWNTMQRLIELAATLDAPPTPER